MKGRCINAIQARGGPHIRYHGTTPARRFAGPLSLERRSDRPPVFLQPDENVDAISSMDRVLAPGGGQAIRFGPVPARSGNPTDWR